ncbi:MAG: 50S ribosomal protein L5 [Candidatus Omnitrophica bacterium]|nr:50S ribosomal protein L5 [Candidatus Omnitrophota bacterium]
MKPSADAKKTAPTAAPVAVPRLQERYRQAIVPSLIKRFGYRNPMQAPRLQKIVLNMGVGEAAHDAKALEEALQTLTLITGQRPAITRAKKDISNFKIRSGNAVGCKVTLRGARMYEFLDRLITAALPRVRDFRGISPTGFDQGGNFSMGLKEHTIFPELELDKVKMTLGMDITMVTSARRRDEALELLKQFGMPFAESKV